MVNNIDESYVFDISYWSTRAHFKKDLCRVRFEPNQDVLKLGKYDVKNWVKISDVKGIDTYRYL